MIIKQKTCRSRSFFRLCIRRGGYHPPARDEDGTCSGYHDHKSLSGGRMNLLVIFLPYGVYRSTCFYEQTLSVLFCWDVMRANRLRSFGISPVGANCVRPPYPLGCYVRKSSPFFLWRSRPKKEPKKGRFGNFARCDERLGALPQAPANFCKSLIKTFNLQD